MKYLWNITVGDYMAIVEIAKKLGVKPGESMEQIFLKYMEIKGKKPMGATELTKEEMIKEYNSHGKTILDINTDSKGKQSYKIDKGEDKKS